MKICEKCGTPQKDGNTVCVECGAVLGGPLAPEKEQAVLSAEADAMEKRAERRGWFEYDFLDPFTPGWKQKTAAVIDLLLAAFALLSIYGAELLPVREPDFCLFTVLFCGLPAVDLLFPEINWGLLRLRAEFRGLSVSDDPSEHYMFLYRLFDLVLPIIGALLLLYAYYPFLS